MDSKYVDEVIWEAMKKLMDAESRIGEAIDTLSSLKDQLYEIRKTKEGLNVRQ